MNGERAEFEGNGVELGMKEHGLEWKNELPRIVPDRSSLAKSIPGFVRKSRACQRKAPTSAGLRRWPRREEKLYKCQIAVL